MPGASEFTTRPELAGTFGMVASTHWLASAAGQAVLEPTVQTGAGRRGDTCHVDVADRFGNLVSATPRAAAPRTLDVEERAGEGVITELRRRGHEVIVYPPWSLGRVSAVARRGGLLYAAANPRGMQGYAVGR